jgi:hypothetical protein
VTLSTDVKAFITDHQPHGELTGDADEPPPTGYRLWITCPCGVKFERWVFPDDAAEDLAFLARLN